jgi:hypothetical protein
MDGIIKMGHSSAKPFIYKLFWMKYHLTLQYTFWTYFENHIFKNSALWNEAYMFQQERYCKQKKDGIASNCYITSVQALQISNCHITSMQISRWYKDLTDLKINGHVTGLY